MHRLRPAARLLVFMLLLAYARDAGAQSIRGRVIDAQSGAPMGEGVRVELLDGRGQVEARTTTRQDGQFLLQAPREDGYRLRATMLGYRETATDVQLKFAEEMVVELRMSVNALALEPLVVTGTRRDNRNDATFEAMLDRHSSLPKIGAERVVLFDETEMRNASQVRDVLRWINPRLGSERGVSRPPQLSFAQRVAGPLSTSTGGCVVWFRNGTLIDNAELASEMASEATVHYEAVEYYRYWAEAPMDYRQTPGYLFLANIYNCSVVAVWSRRTPLPPVNVVTLPFRARLIAGGAVQQVGGRHAPEPAAAARAELLWYVGRSLAIGLHGRHAVAPMDAGDFETVTGLEGAGAREYTVQMYGFTTRYDFQPVWRMRPFVSGRVVMGHRRFNPFLAEDAEEAESKGKGFGVSGGIEYDVTRHVSVYTALDHERTAFEAFHSIRRAGDETQATWSTTSLSAGVSLQLRK